MKTGEGPTTRPGQPLSTTEFDSGVGIRLIDNRLVANHVVVQRYWISISGLTYQVALSSCIVKSLNPLCALISRLTVGFEHDGAWV